MHNGLACHNCSKARRQGGGDPDTGGAYPCVHQDGVGVMVGVIAVIVALAIHPPSMLAGRVVVVGRSASRCPGCPSVSPLLLDGSTHVLRHGCGYWVVRRVLGVGVRPLFFSCAGVVSSL